MKNYAIKKYLLSTFIFSLIYLAATLVMDFIFNGAVIDYLVSVLPYSVFMMIWSNKQVISWILYTVGFAAISVVHIFKLAHLLKITGEAISNELPILSDDKCPDELKEFSKELKSFKQLIKSNEEARRAAEQQKNDLIVYLAHDLKTPLTSVIGYLSLLYESPDLPCEQRAKYTGVALDKAYRLENLINEFFEITRLNLQNIPTQKTEVNLTVLLLQVINEFYPMLEERGMTVAQNISSELRMKGDPDKLARVFENLLKNAVNYGTENTEIVCNAYLDAGRITVELQNASDDISPENLSHIFDKFYRLDSARRTNTGGTGLGLAIAKQIVELHGGSIRAESIESKTKFTVSLPI